MVSSVTSAGAASGIDFESIISASVAAKKASLSSRISSKKENTQLEITGVGLLKSNLTTFKDLLDNMTKENAFNKRAVTSNQSTTDPVFSVETKDSAANGNYNLTVKQLAQSTSFSTSFSSLEETFGSGGSLTFAIGSGDDAKSFSVEVGEGDTLNDIRNKINNSADSFGVTANIITLQDGTAKLVLDSCKTGESYSNFSVTASGDESLNAFNASITTDENGNKVASGDSSMKLVRAGQDALLDVDGDTLSSSTNVFDDTIKGLKITVNRLSDTEKVESENGTETGFKSNTLSITTDTSSLKKMMNEFVSTYNELRTNLDNLTKNNTYSEGKSNDDGGYLAGDSTGKTIKNAMSNLLTSFTIGGESSGLSLFSLGLEVDNKGNLSVNSEKFEDAINNKYDQVVAAFTGKNGVCAKLSSNLETYTKTGGILDLRKDSLNSELRSIENQENANSSYLAKYEESLRNRYGNLDTMIGTMNTSLSYLTSALSSMNVNNSKSSS
ncbi:flagellar filament capping protein FliD [Succinimonas amylolytica]|uniref:flagellar filament capping protein FliD n=1 Tax=Succinimonas amylolytica TaxID=83769 RepID=UPI0003667746|nr:flagellar filament capping protein FliD [Succinimonas amylolytica]